MSLELFDPNEDRQRFLKLNLYLKKKGIKYLIFFLYVTIYDAFKILFINILLCNTFWNPTAIIDQQFVSTVKGFKDYFMELNEKINNYHYLWSIRNHCVHVFLIEFNLNPVKTNNIHSLKQSRFLGHTLVN